MLKSSACDERERKSQSRTCTVDTTVAPQKRNFYGGQRNCMFALGSLIQRIGVRAGTAPLQATASLSTARPVSANPRKPLQIYHVPGTRSIRVLWVCEELGVNYEKITISFSKEYRSSAEWRALNPGAYILCFFFSFSPPPPPA